MQVPCGVASNFFSNSLVDYKIGLGIFVYQIKENLWFLVSLFV